MACSNYNNLIKQDLSEKDITYKYWYEFLYPLVLGLEIEIDNNILDKNYEFFKLSENFKGKVPELQTYLGNK
jgi:hypothetical protein